MSALKCLENLPFEPLPHQSLAAEKVLGVMDGRAILADEVGLGKTIEAGLIVKELLEQEKIQRVLILTPSSLAPQWCMEMKDKFELYFYHNRRDHNWTYFSFIVASIDRAKRQEQLESICQADFDLLIVDEAHRLKNNSTANFKAVQKINPRYLLLLTATPMQNNLKELYNLVELVRPGLFKDLGEFQARFIAEDEAVTNSDQLQKALSKVMIRNNKRDVKLKLPARKVELMAVSLTPKERLLYQGVNNYIKEEYRRRRMGRSSILSLITLQREICSSSFAARNTLQKMGLNDLAALAEQINENQKAHAVEDILQREQGKTLIFTEFKATQAYLYTFLSELGIPALCYNGDLKPWDRLLRRELFQREYPVMISTEAGGEGVNLQKANIVINYDLPWNPIPYSAPLGVPSNVLITKR